MNPEHLKYYRNKDRVAEIYGGRCANFDYCHSYTYPENHHIVQRQDKGHLVSEDYPIDDEANYAALCNLCHFYLHRLISFVELGKPMEDNKHDKRYRSLKPDGK